MAISKWSPKTRYLHKYADSPCRASSLPFGHQFLMNKSTSLDFGVRSKHTFHMPVKSNYRNSKHSDGKGLFDVFGVILFLFILLINGIIRLITRKTRKFQKLTIVTIPNHHKIPPPPTSFRYAFKVPMYTSCLPFSSLVQYPVPKSVPWICRSRICASISHLL